MTNEIMLSLAKGVGYAAIGMAAIGSAIGAGIAGQAAIGAWKKCYAQGKAAPFLLLAMVGAPLSQTIYGMLMMIFITGKATAAFTSNTALDLAVYISVGILGGLAQMISAILQGKAAACGCVAFAETNQGFANYFVVLGVIETCAIFALVFSLMVL